MRIVTVEGEAEVDDLNRATSENVISGETIEMQENVLDYPYPIHSGPNIITSQPYGQVQESRRETYQNSLDWISTPRPQLSILSGTNFLGNVEQLVIQQVVDLSTLLGRTERRLQYRVKIPRGETLFLAMLVDTEVGLSTPLLCSELIPRCGDFDLNVVDQFGQPAFKMKISSRWTCPLSKLRKITVGNANLIGTVEQNFTIIGPSFTVYDDARNELCNVIGPNICGCCMYKEAHFQVITNDGTHQIASLMHQWDNTLRDYVLLISFPEATDIKLKSLILATAFLLVHMYFEQVRPKSLRT
ncbi:phospholipid scramblase 1 isoform X1 [Megalopta genalis]|uniref:phospholipid scramblase 1 isoform X1 n=1 Tax=Megalopta genalis TaxID=115081 RepID=UPI003FD0CEF2